MSNTSQTVRKATKACLDLAQEHFDVDMRDVVIRFDLDGDTIAVSGYGDYRFGRYLYYLRFNIAKINAIGVAHFIHNIVPHEVAHLVCLKGLKLANDSGRRWSNDSTRRWTQVDHREWARVCLALTQ